MSSEDSAFLNSIIPDAPTTRITDEQQAVARQLQRDIAESSTIATRIVGTDTVARINALIKSAHDLKAYVSVTPKVSVRIKLITPAGHAGEWWEVQLHDSELSEARILVKAGAPIILC